MEDLEGQEPYIYWIKYSQYGDIHSRSKYLSLDMTDEELAYAIKFPQYQWTMKGRARTVRKRPDWNHLNYILLEENVSKLTERYPKTGIELKSKKVKGLERFYLSYYIYIMGNIYRKKTKNFKVTENQLETLEQYLDKHRKYLIK